MPVTAYCKKCARDVTPGERCPECGGKLTKASLRLAWQTIRTPMKDWMAWNSIMRVLLPLEGVILLLTMLFELFGGGLTAVERLLTPAFFGIVSALVAFSLLMVLIALKLQGNDLQDCIVDSKGLSVTTYLPYPTPAKLLARGKAPSAPITHTAVDGTPLSLVSRHEIPWNAIHRIQLWPEKGLILLYAPTWWLAVAVPCTAETYEDALVLISEKLGKRKQVILPYALTIPPAERKKKKAPAKAKETQISMPLPTPTAEDEDEGDRWVDSPVTTETIAED